MANDLDVNGGNSNNINGKDNNRNDAKSKIKNTVSKPKKKAVANDTGPVVNSPTQTPIGRMENETSMTQELWEEEGAS